MKHAQNQNIRKHGKTALKATALLLLGGVSIMWGWDTLAVDLAGANPIKFRHALAFEFVAVGLFLLQGFFIRLAVGILQSSPEVKGP